MRGRAISPCGPTSLAREGVPMHPERLSALRSLALSEGKLANLGGLMTRENDDARATYTAVIPGPSAARSPESILRSRGYGFRARRFAAPRNDSSETAIAEEGEAPLESRPDCTF